MADPLSVVGVGLGAISLILQVTDECVKSYKYFSEALHMPEEYRYLTVRLQIEQQRFLHFALEAELLSGESIPSVLQVNPIVLQNALSEIHSIFQDYARANGRYIDAKHDDGIDWGCAQVPESDLIKKISITKDRVTRRCLQLDEGQQRARAPTLRDFTRYAKETTRKIRTVIADPKRLLWVRVDRADFERLISRLSDMNSFLISLVDRTKALKLDADIARSYIEILQLRQDVKQLENLVKALSVNHSSQTMRNTHSQGAVEDHLQRSAIAKGSSDEEHRRYLKVLTTIKIRRIRAEQIERVGRQPLQNMKMLMDVSSLTVVGPQSPTARRVAALWRNAHVWLEWLDDAVHESELQVSDTQSEGRIASLSTLLSTEMPLRFRVPQCLGYIKKPTSGQATRFGLIFRNGQTNSSFSTKRLVDLRQLLDTQPPPTIPRRILLCVTLAECLNSFHTVDWLHKGLRSENIVFPIEKGNISFGTPYTMGYGLSRPDEGSTHTIKPAFNPAADMYRHPYAQHADGATSYRKSYDIYSLGILFTEIAFWKPIERILEIEDATALKAFELRVIKDKLLGVTSDDLQENTLVHQERRIASKYLFEVGNIFGESYQNMVHTCLRADDLERPLYRGEPTTAVGVRLRLIFEQEVLNKLRYMHTALNNTE